MIIVLTLSESPQLGHGYAFESNRCHHVRSVSPLYFRTQKTDIQYLGQIVVVRFVYIELALYVESKK